MNASQGEFLKVNVAFLILILYHDASILKVGTLLDLVLLGERQFLGLGDNLVKMIDGDFVVRVEDEAVLRPEIPDNAELGPDIILHVVSVPVEMVRSDVCDHGYVRPELIAVVQLETTDFQYIIVKMLSCHLQCVALAYVSAEADVETGFLEKIVYQ